MNTKYPTSILEEELKNRVAADWFAAFDSTRILARIDFCIALPPSPLFPDEIESLLWAEAKKGTRADIYASFVQLILTVGRERTAEKYLPPKFLGAFDVREREGSFFTPPEWVELSQEYLRRELGDDWQEQYYIWDCCAGTGNLLAGLTNKYRIYASTLD